MDTEYRTTRMLCICSTTLQCSFTAMRMWLTNYHLSLLICPFLSQSGSPRSTTRAVPPPVVQIKSQLQKPLTVDITQSPTYQLLQEEEEYVDNSKDRAHLHAPGQYHTGHHGHSPSKFSPKHSPNYPQQTPYFRSLMNSLLPNPGI